MDSVGGQFQRWGFGFVHHIHVGLQSPFLQSFGTWPQVFLLLELFVTLHGGFLWSQSAVTYFNHATQRRT